MMTHRPRKFVRWASLAVMIAAAPSMGQGLLTRAKVVPSDSAAGAGALYTINFRTSQTGTGVPANGKIRITFPPSFADSTISAAINIYGLNGGYSAVKDTNHVLTLTRDNTGTALAAGDSAQIKLAIVKNSAVADTFRLFIETLTVANVRIDSAKSPVFRIIHGPLDHFTINSIVTPPTAGVNFNLVMSARDAYQNVVKTFIGTVSLTANQGTLIPATSGAFVQGSLTQAVRTNFAGAGRVITATAGTGQSGSSNAFTVNPNTLHHFAVSTIASPQTAGIGFPVTFTAQDSLNNTLTSFASTATITATLGTVTPAVSGAFANGVRTENLTFNQSVTGTSIVVANSGKTGASNTFNVNVGALDHFTINAIATQTAGNTFTMTITAKDLNGNTVTSFNGTVNLSDNTGTLSPATSANFASGVRSQLVSISKARSGAIISVNDGAGHLGQSNSFTVNSAALDHFAVTNTSDLDITSQTAGIAFNIKIVAQDQYNNTVTTYSGAGTAVAMNNATTSLAPTTSGNFTSGVLSSQSVTISKSNSADAIVVTGGTPSRNGTSNNFAINAGAAAGFQIATIASPQTAGALIPLQVTAVDANGNTATSFTSTATLSVSGGGTITPGVSGNFVAGVWNGNVTISSVGNNRTITVSSGALNATSNAFNVVGGGLDHFVIISLATQTAGQNFSVTVTAQDVNNNNIAHTGTVSLSDNTGTLTAAALVFNAQTSQTIANANITKAQSNVLVTASGSGATGASNAFTVNPAALDHFRVTNTSDGNIVAQVAGTAFSVRVVAQDLYNNTVTSYNQPVNITDLTNVNSTSAALSSGVLASQNVTVNQTRNDNQLTASGGAPQKTGASNLFNVNPGALNSFTLDTISDQATGAPFSITIRARDAQNNVKTDFAGTVTISDLTGTITPASSGSFISGVRQESVSISQTRTNNTISVSGSGKNGTSNTFNVQAVTVDHFDLSSIGNQTAGTGFSVTITARDASNNTVTNFTGTVTLSDLSGAIAPTTSNSFTAGVLTQSFTITKSYTGDKITVTGVGKSNQSNAFNVAPAALNKFAIATVPDQAAGQSFPLTIMAQDQYDNTVTGFSGAVTIALNTGTIAPTTSGAFSAGVKTVSVTIPAAGNNRIINVTDGSGHNGASNSFNVSASGLNGFVFSMIPTQQAGTNFSFTITAKDASNNDVNFSGTVTLTDATGTLTPTSVAMNGTSVTVNNARLTKKQDGVFITATGGGKSSISNQFNVIPGALQRVRVVEGSSGDFPELTTKTLNADQTLPVHAAGYDAFGNYIADQNVDWQVAVITANIGAFDNPSNAASTIFSANTVGTGRIVAHHATALDDSSGVITVTAGVPFRVKILASTSGNTTEVAALSLTTGQFQDMHASSFDADDNRIQDLSASWTLSGNIGSLSQSSGISTRFTAATQGSGQISAHVSGLIDDATGTISVTSGTLARIRIVEGASGNGTPFTGRNLTTDESLTLHAAGYDASGNYLNDFTVAWLVRGGIGTVTPVTGISTSFDPKVPGPGRIVADHATALDDSTNQFTVSAGAPVRVKVLTGASGNTGEVQDVTLITGDPLDVHASSFDNDNNRIGDVAVTWRLSNNIGSLNPSFGNSTRLTATNAGFGVITADHATLIDDATGTIEVRSGSLSYIKVVLGPSGAGAELGNLSRTTDEVVQVHAAGYDAQNNYLGDQSVDWSISGNTIGLLSPVTGTSTTLTLTRPGTARIFANHAFATDDSTGTITVTVGALARIKILSGDTGNQLEVEDRNLTADESLTVHAGGFDADNNYINDFVVDWSITGAAIGALSSNNGKTTTFSANKTGVGQIRAVHATAGNDVTGSITVTPGALAHIKVIEGASGPGTGELGTKTMRTDQELMVHAGVFDADDNYIRDEPVTWSSAGTLAPTVNATGTSISFQPTVAPASGTIRGTHAIVGFDDTGTITVNVGPLHHVQVLSGASGATTPQGATTMFAGNQITVHAGGFDAKNNYISDEVVNWTVDGNIGNLSTANGISTIFSAVRTGPGSLRADHPNAAVLDANSGTITVATGTVTRIELRTAPNNGGATFGAYTMTADSSVTIYAAGYDAGNNYLGDFSVTWSSTGTLAPAVNSTGSSFIFSPTTAAANNSINGTIVGTYTGGITDPTGTITVLPGNPSGTVDLTPIPTSLPADGSSTTTITSIPIADKESNLVGAGRLFTVSVTPPTYGQITDADLDPNTPGKQIATNAQSLLRFTFKAGTIGGVATVSVNSGLGANGSVPISLGSLNISNISAAPANVTRGQSGVNVSMAVQNLGTTPIQNLSGGLIFTGTQDRTTDYTVTPVNGNPVQVAGNSVVTLNYTVSVSGNAALENIVIDGNVAGTVNGTPVSKSGANLKDSWQVQRPAQLTVQSVSTSVDTVARGQGNLAVTVRVANNAGQTNSATARIDSVRLRFRSGAADKSVEYSVTADGNNPTTISGNSTADFNFVVNVSSGATLGDIVLDAEAYGRDANSGASTTDLNATTTDDWTVIPGNPFRIVSITPIQNTVTANMTRPWTAQMQLQNLTSNNVTLNLAPSKTFIRFIVGSDVTSQYTIEYPTQLNGNGGLVLHGNSTGTLTFRITQTGTTSGPITIAGVVEGTDAAGLKVADDTNDGGTGVVTVQTPGTLEIRSALVLSQATVTRDQTAPWTITANVTNGGQSAIRYLKDSTRVSVGNNANYIFDPPPQNFADGDSILEANETKALVLTVRQTGNQTGALTATVRLTGRELNSNNFKNSNTGSGQVTVQTPASLVIQSVRASQAKVTASQTNAWQIVMVVNNPGESQVSVKVDTSTNIKFRVGNQIRNDYTASLSPANWLGTSSRTLPGNTTDSLRFTVIATGSVPGVASILAKVAATESNSGVTRVANNSTATVTVQSPPTVTYIAGSLEPKTVNNGSQYAFKVRVRNSGGATVDLTPASTLFTFSGGGSSFGSSLDQNKTRSIAPGADTTLFFVGQFVPANMPQTTYTPVVQLNGAHNGNSYSSNINLGANELRVTAPAQLQVVSMHSSQVKVTAEMQKDWYIMMTVANNGSSAARLDSVDLQLFNGGNATRDFVIDKPVKFLGSNGTNLPAQGRDSLRFEIRTTGARLGNTSVLGYIRVVDLSNNQKISTQSSGNNGSFVVQSPAILNITALRPSQTTITQNQTKTWSIDMEVKNAGQSEVRIQLDSTKTFVKLALNAGDYRLKWPSALVQGGDIIPGDSTRTLRFDLTKTGTQLGPNNITGQMSAIEVNSDDPRFDDTQSGGSSVVTVQSEARLKIASTVLNPTTSTPNLPHVNTGQAFEVRVVVQNSGTEATDNVQIRLASTGGSIFAENPKTIPGGVSGGLTNSVVFNATASSLENLNETLTATIFAATAHNTGTTAKQDAPVDNSEAVIVQRPAGLQIVNVLTSIPEVVAFSNVPWTIAVVLQDTGRAAVALDPPEAVDIGIKISGQAASGYTIEPPAALAMNGGLILPGGQIDTLIYTVRSTGGTAGVATISATVTGKDQNNNQSWQAARNGQITVTTTAYVKINSTQPIVNNFFQGSGVGLVNTDQNFAVAVEVDNGSLEDVSQVLVELVTNGVSQIQTPQQTIAVLPHGSQQQLSFAVRAASNPDNVPETFVARILAATAAQGGGPAAIFRGADTTAQVRIQLPAELTLNVTSDFSNLTTRQLFDLKATVSNRANGADIDETGRLTLSLPDGFEIESPGSSAFERPFLAGQAVVWKLRAPEFATAGPLIVNVTTVPRDLNSNGSAIVAKAADSANVSVVQTNLSISKTVIVEPAGAVDGTVSTTQFFKIQASLSFSQDLGNKKITLSLPANTGYEFRAGSSAEILDFSEQASWEVRAPDTPVDTRWFAIKAEGVTENGTGVLETRIDSVRVQTVQRATLDFAVKLDKGVPDTTGSLTVNQAFTIRATLTNLGGAAAVDTTTVRLQLGDTGVTTSDSLEKKIYIPRGSSSGVVEWVAKAPPVPTRESTLTVQLLSLLNDENSGGPAAWDRGIDKSVITKAVRTDTVGTLFVSQLLVSDPAGAADNVLSSEQDFKVRASITGTNLTEVDAELFVPPGFNFVSENDKIQRLPNFVGETSATVSWQVKAPLNRSLQQPIFARVKGKDANSGAEIDYTSANLVIDVIEAAQLLLDAAITSPSSVVLDNIASINQAFVITASLGNIGQADTAGAAIIKLELPLGYSTAEPLTKTTVNGTTSWQITARSTPSVASEEIKLNLQQPYPKDKNTGRDARVVGLLKTLSIRTEAPSLTVTDASASQGITGGPVISQQKGVPVLGLSWRNEGDEGSSKIVIKSLQFYVASRQGAEVPPNAAIARVQVVASDNPNRVFGQLTEIPNTNPLALSFSVFDTVGGGTARQATVLIDVASNATVNDFFLNVRSGEDIVAVNADAPSPRIQVQLAGGTITSAAAVLSSANYAESFYNYPNPFSPVRDQKTLFNYALPQDSDIDFRIFTMLGELVYTQSFKASDPQGRAGARNTGVTQGFVEWDGKNGNGDQVFNGVYMAVLKSNAGTVMTKVAVVK